MAELNETLVEQWHPTANMGLLPTDFTAGSGKKAHWLCSKGHAWEAMILNRSKGQGCPVCAGRVTLVGFNDLTTTNPELISEWHPTKNEGFLPTQATKGSHRKVWWQDQYGHEWISNITNRVHGNGCPVCANLKILVGFNDLATTQPLLAAEWHPTKNYPLTPQDITQGVSKAVWWLCSSGHEYRTAPSNRKDGDNCPFCSNRQLLLGFNDLATTHPKLATQWHPTKNGTLKPSQITLHKHVTVWWLCDKGHTSKTATAAGRFNYGCPYCSGRFAIEGETDLLSQNPDVAQQLHPVKNGDLLPSQVTEQSNKRAWWLCSLGHEWNTTIGDRYRGQGCPFCSSHQILVGYNDFASTYPEMARQWHPVKNGDLTSQQVTRGNDKNVWWLGLCKHEWQASVHTRLKGVGCPFCANYTALAGFNDLATVKPELAAEWHPIKNGQRKPEHVVYGSAEKVWWQCAFQHEWKTAVVKRTNGTGCPECYALSSSSKPEQELYDFISSFGLTVEKANRKVLGNRKEVDLYVPELKLAVEFNGIYWHNENWKGEVYHYEKWAAAKTAGIQLIHVWEDDWYDRKDIILRLLTARLGVTDQLPTLYPELTQGLTAVDTIDLNVVVIDADKCEQFMTTNHLHGFEPRGQHVGLEDVDGVLRAVLTVSKHESDTLQVERYAAAGEVTGGFERLLSHAMNETGVSTVVADVDHAFDDGKWLEAAGFEPVQEFEPDYMYVVAMKRVPKTMFTPEYFQNHSRYVWEEGFSSRELADKNRVPRIWDAGHTRYQLFS
jgi:hypothetical protein